MTVTSQNAPGIEEFVEEVKDWPVTGIAFTFYVPSVDDDTGLGWPDLRDRRRVDNLRRDAAEIAHDLRLPELVDHRVE